MAIAFGAAISGNAALVSVTTDAVTGGNAASVTTARNDNAGNLVGPAGDSPGSTWNIISGYSATNLLDSTGASTSIGYTTTFSERRGTTLSSGDLEIARTYMQDFGKGGSNTITINGLMSGSLYNVWLVSVSNSGTPTENYRGDFITANPTSSSSTQTVNASPRNVTTFVAGQNFALFENVVADVNGEISFEADAANLDGQPNTGDEYRFGLNGFQILEVPEPSTALLGGIGALMLLRRRR